MFRVKENVLSTFLIATIQGYGVIVAMIDEGEADHGFLGERYQKCRRRS